MRFYSLLQDESHMILLLDHIFVPCIGDFIICKSCKKIGVRIHTNGVLKVVLHRFVVSDEICDSHWWDSRIHTGELKFTICIVLSGARVVVEPGRDCWIWDLFYLGVKVDSLLVLLYKMVEDSLKLKKQLKFIFAWKFLALYAYILLDFILIQMK